MPKPKYTVSKDGRTQISYYADRMEIRQKSFGTTGPIGSVNYQCPSPLAAPAQKPPSPRAILRQQLGLDSIGKTKPGQP